MSLRTLVNCDDATYAQSRCNSMEYKNTVTDEASLEALYGQPGTNSLTKEVDALTPEYRKWIEQSPFMAIASIGQGGLDCSPRGDAPGQLFRILDDQTIAVPDRRGNNRLDTLRNLVTDPRISLLFLLPGINETMRINGLAQVVTDTAIRQSFLINNQEPKTVIVVNIKSVYFQCARALLRSRLWSAENVIEKSKVPTAGQMSKGTNAEFDAEQYDADLPDRQKSTLY